MLNYLFSILGAAVVVAILWGSATWARMKLNRPASVQKWIDALAVVLLIVSIAIFLAFGKQLFGVFTK